MPIIAEIPPVALISGAVTIAVALIGFITKIAQKIFEYQNDRIRVLEGREQTVLGGVADSIENISASVKTTSEYIAQLVEEARYRERRRQEERP
ncbi:MAG: hypothetical protein LC793_20345 [Thermomicrobia bacterium]|nr:hypothetical protein [Thermomicrobia bacterium]